jgi:tRNA(Ile)-lysidine synthetase-like protein
MNPGDVLDGGLRVRFGVEGLSCRPAGGGRRRALKKLYQERDVPPWVRPYLPLVFAAGSLVAVGGLWVCDAGPEGDGGVGRVRWTGAPEEGLGIDLNGGG